MRWKQLLNHIENPDGQDEIVYSLKKHTAMIIDRLEESKEWLSKVKQDKIEQSIKDYQKACKGLENIFRN